MIKPRILLIDDEESILKVYKEKMDLMGLDTLIAAGGEEGIRIASEEKPDLILLDIIMPQYNGFDALRKLKLEDNTKDIPVYILTNLQPESSFEKAKEMGAKGYFVKANYSPETLALEVKKALNL